MIGTETKGNDIDLELDDGEDEDEEVFFGEDDLSYDEVIQIIIDYGLEPMALPDGSIAIWSDALSNIVSDELGSSLIEDSIRNAMTLCAMPLPSVREDGIDDLKAWRTTLERLLAIVDGALAMATEDADSMLGSA